MTWAYIALVSEAHSSSPPPPSPLHHTTTHHLTSSPSEALSIDPHNRSTNAKLYFNRATVAAKLKKQSESIADCDKALELDPGYTKALLRRAKSYMELEQYDEAVRDYEKVHKGDRGNQEYR